MTFATRCEPEKADRSLRLVSAVTLTEARVDLSQHADTDAEPIRIGVFSDVEPAQEAVTGLLRAGFTTEQITVVCSDEVREQYFRQFEHQQPAGTKTPGATAIGIAVGGGIRIWKLGNPTSRANRDE